MLPLLATLAIAASLLLLDKMLTLFDFVAAEGGPVSVVWRMLANLIPEYLSLGIPIGLLLGILLAFRKLATSSELDIFRAVGMSYLRLLRVPFLLAIALAVYLDHVLYRDQCVYSLVYRLFLVLVLVLVY